VLENLRVQDDGRTEAEFIALPAARPASARAVTKASGAAESFNDVGSSHGHEVAERRVNRGNFTKGIITRVEAGTAPSRSRLVWGVGGLGELTKGGV